MQKDSFNYVLIEYKPAKTAVSPRSSPQGTFALTSKSSVLKSGFKLYRTEYSCKLTVLKQQKKKQQAKEEFTAKQLKTRMIEANFTSLFY